MEKHGDSLKQRRVFLGILLSLTGSVIAILATLPILRFLWPLKFDVTERLVTIPRSKIKIGEAYFFQFSGQPAVLLQISAGQFSAFSAVCTHLGCVVKWQPEKGEFLCPCHAGRFSSTGLVLAGPPPEPLKVLPVNLLGDQLTIG